MYIICLVLNGFFYAKRTEIFWMSVFRDHLFRVLHVVTRAAA